MEFAIETNHLKWKYQNEMVLKGISLRVPKGAIYGFLGHNGAGKTTTIKLLLNLLKAPIGQIKVLGIELQKNRIAVLEKTGALIEQPGIYAHLTGYENLKLKATILNISKDKIEEILSTVNLLYAANKKAGEYSQGMKQRLGIGLALLSNPELLILDEPTNGLDPNGISEIRALIQNLRLQGKTIFISSHLLAEIEKFATHIGILHQGNLVYQGTLQELKIKSEKNLIINTSEIDACKVILDENHIGYILEQNNIIINKLNNMNSAFINKILVDNQISVDEIYFQENNLEELFFDLTK